MIDFIVKLESVLRTVPSFQNLLQCLINQSTSIYWFPMENTS